MQAPILEQKCVRVSDIVYLEKYIFIKKYPRKQLKTRIFPGRKKSYMWQHCPFPLSQILHK